MQNHLNEVERIKQASDYLRGGIEQGLADGATAAIADSDTQLTKFHGIYQQDDRDLRDERRRQMLEPAYQFMIRARMPGGVCSPEQWLAIDRIAREYSNGSIRLTTRQTFQLHGVLKGRLKPAIQAINQALLDTIAACGDVNRNVIASSLPELSAVHRQVYRTAAAISEHLTPATRAYHEIWLDGQRVAGDEDQEPVYGPTYLPRKFKIAVAVPPSNDVDVLAHDLGFIAIVEARELKGFNVTVGGGMGATHGDPATFPRIADVLGFCTPDQVLAVAEAIVTIQRDFGDRSNRKHARFKYTVADRGLDWLGAELADRMGGPLAPARAFRFTTTTDAYGWRQGDDGLWYLTLFIASGRVADSDEARVMSGLRALAEIHQGEFRLTANQNLMVAGVRDADRPAVDSVVAEHGLDGYRRFSLLKRGAMACVALPTCGLAMAEAERYLPDLVGRIEQLQSRHGLEDQPITLRMTGCPNGCARPYLAEIGLVGKAPGRYNLHLGAAAEGTRLNRLALENVDEATILSTLDETFAAYAADARQKESFGDFIQRSGWLTDQPAGSAL